MFALQNAPGAALALEGVQVSRLPLETHSAKFDLSLSVRESAEGLRASWEFSTDLFDAPTIERMARHFERLLEGIVADPEQRIGELPLLTEAERHQLLVEWNDTAADYPRDRCIHELFEAQVARTPEAVAVVFEDRQLTYGELNARANQLAHHLIALGVGPEVLVGICMERSLELIVGLLGILKAGGAYVPLDPGYPAERLAFMLKDTAAPVLLTQQGLLGQLPQYEGRIVCLDRDAPDINAHNDKPTRARHATSEALAYVIYTSGSTGHRRSAAQAHPESHDLLCYTVVDERKQIPTIPMDIRSPNQEYSGSASATGSGWRGGAAVPAARRCSRQLATARSSTEHFVHVRTSRHQAHRNHTRDLTHYHPKATYNHHCRSPRLRHLYLRIHRRAERRCRTSVRSHSAGAQCELRCAVAVRDDCTGVERRLRRRNIRDLGRAAQWRPAGDRGKGCGARAGIFRRRPNSPPNYLPVPDDCTFQPHERHHAGSISGRSTTLLFGGEACDGDRVRAVLEVGPPAHLIHVYGPTETTTFATFHPIRHDHVGDRTIPIGRPISGTQVFILDRYSEPVPIGITGEIFIGGPGVAAGYVNRPQETDARFIAHPFCPDARAPNCAGMPARYLPDGNIEFLGRNDDQIKIRGFRIEPTEVRAVLNRHATVRKSLVTINVSCRESRKPLHDPHVRATWRFNRAFSELRHYLALRLPQWMVPNSFIAMSSIPLTPNGKVDRRALPPPSRATEEECQSYSAPRDKLERTLCLIWEEMLGAGRIGLDDNFFELGGHSLLAASLFSRLDQTLGRALPLATLFEAPVIARTRPVLPRRRRPRIRFDTDTDRTSV